MLSDTRKSLLLSAGLLALVCVSLSIGYYAGKRLALDPVRDRIASFATSETLGRLLPPEQLHAMAQAYLDPVSAESTMNEITWAVPNAPTPFLGSGPAPGVHANTTINDLQFRDTRPLIMPKPIGVFRIFLTGGSTAFGSGAPNQSSTIGAYLEERLNAGAGRNGAIRYEVFTLANPAWASTHERIAIENRLSEMDPDLVISFSGNNDVHWGFRGRNIMWFWTYADKHFLGLLNEIYQTSGGSSLPGTASFGETPVPCDLVAGRLLKNVELSVFALDRVSVPYLFVLQPSLAVTGKPLSERETDALDHDARSYFESCYLNIERTLSNQAMHGFIYSDLSGVFDDLDANEEVFLDSYHFGDKGNALIADRLFGVVRDRVLH